MNEFEELNLEQLCGSLGILIEELEKEQDRERFRTGGNFHEQADTEP